MNLINSYLIRLSNTSKTDGYEPRLPPASCIVRPGNLSGINLLNFIVKHFHFSSRFVFYKRAFQHQ